MAKPKTNRVNVSRMGALALHAEANKSDPFAAKRMAMTFNRDGYREIKEVHAESKRLIEAGTNRRERYGSADWLSVDQIIALNELRSELCAAQKPKRVRKPKASMSQYLNKADYAAAQAVA